MSNPQDDPGHRPPSPRPGEHPPYQGGPPPPQYQQGPPPQQQWQQPPPGYGLSQTPQGYPAPPRGKGFFGSLFDIGFNDMVSTRMIRIVYVLAILLISLTSVFIFLVGLWSLQFEWGKYFGVFLVPAAPLLWLFELVVTRVILEFVINQFKITEHLKAMREREGLR